MVDVVRLLLADEDLEEQADCLDDVDAALHQRAQVVRHEPFQVQLLVDLVAADVAEVVVRALEEHPADHLLRVRRGRRIARAHALVDLAQRVLLVVDARLRVLAQRLDQGAVVDRDVDDLHLGDVRRGDLLHHRGGDGVVAARDHGLGVGVHEVVLHHEETEVALGVRIARRQALEIVEERHDLLVAAVAERPEERRRVKFPAAAALVHEAPHDVVRVEHHLDPVAAVGDDAHGEERLAVRVDLALGRDAGRAVQLRDDDALRAVDHERAVGRHHRHVAEEDLLLAHLLAVLEAEGRVERPAVRLAVHERLEVGLLRRAEVVAHEVERVAPVVADDRENLLEDRLQALVLALRRRHVGLEELLVGLGLDLDEVGRRLCHILQFAEHLPFCAHVAFFPWFVKLWVVTSAAKDGHAPGPAFHAPEVW